MKNRDLALARGGKELTIKERNWLQEYLKHGNATKAAMKAYDCSNRSVAGSIGSRVKKQLGFYIQVLLEEEGIDDKYLVEKLKEGLEATKSYNGKTYDDYPTRLQYIKEVRKWKNKEDDKKSGQTNIGEVKILVHRGE